MSNYSQTVFFGPKDSLPLGNPAKLILGTDVDIELANIATAITSKFDSSSIAAGPIGFAAGTVSLPALYLGPDTTTGLYRSAVNQLAVTVSGANALTVAATGLTVAKALTVSGTGTALSVAANASIGGTLAVGDTLTLTPTGTDDLLDANGSVGSVQILSTGATLNFTRGAESLITASAVGGFFGIRVNGNTSDSVRVAASGQLQIVDDGGTLQIAGYRGTPLNSQSVNYTMQLSDRGEAVTVNSASKTVTVPANIFSGGDVVTVLASITSGSISIAPGAGLTLFWANGTGSTTGTRTLTGIGVATVIFTSATTAWVTGSGLS